MTRQHCFLTHAARRFTVPGLPKKKTLMTDIVSTHGLKVARVLHDFIEREVLPGTGIAADAFWSGFAKLAGDLAPKNRALLARRELQQKIDEWHTARRGKLFDRAEYERFLRSIGYLEPEGPDFSVTTPQIDPEVAMLAGPQLDGAALQCALRPQRRQCALGKPV